MSFHYKVFGSKDKKPEAKIWLEGKRVKCDNPKIDAYLDDSYPFGFDRTHDPVDFLRSLPVSFSSGYLYLEKVEDDDA